MGDERRKEIDRLNVRTERAERELAENRQFLRDIHEALAEAGYPTVACTPGPDGDGGFSHVEAVQALIADLREAQREIERLTRERDEAQGELEEIAELLDANGTPLEPGCTHSGLVQNLMVSEGERKAMRIAFGEAGKGPSVAFEERDNGGICTPWVLWVSVGGKGAEKVNLTRRQARALRDFLDEVLGSSSSSSRADGLAEALVSLLEGRLTIVKGINYDDSEV